MFVVLCLLASALARTPRQSRGDSFPISLSVCTATDGHRHGAPPLLQSGPAEESNFLRGLFITQSKWESLCKEGCSPPALPQACPSLRVR